MKIQEMDAVDLLKAYEATLLSSDRDEYAIGILRTEITRRLKQVEVVDEKNYRHPLLKNVRKNAEETLE